LQTSISETDYAQARMVAEPINLLDASPIGDGAAAVLLVPAQDISARNSFPQINIIASAVGIDRIAIHDRHDPLWFTATKISVKKAYSQAAVGSISSSCMMLFLSYRRSLWRLVDLLGVGWVLSWLSKKK